MILNIQNTIFLQTELVKKKLVATKNSFSFSLKCAFGTSSKKTGMKTNTVPLVWLPVN